ncbi:glycosyltransferase family 2 protein [Enterocloster aldenensis]|uniref:glycosyltransferase family 2 protein n=1 Tax=Enterocloster aldenensis TaxID=358742 RepID=UPI004025C4FC
MSERKPKISIIMGVYNGEKTLDEAIKSICNQTFSDWELIVCDDCSTDNTDLIIQQWCKQEPRIIGMRNDCNRKLAATLNRCLESASGVYIARMDDDDISYPERLEVQNHFLDEHLEYGFVSSLIDGYDGERVIHDFWHRKERPESKDFLSGSQFVHPATMFRSQALMEVNGYRSSSDTRRMEDYDLFMRLYAAGYRGYNIQQPLLQYYVNSEKTLFRYRFDEMRVRYRGFYILGLMPYGLLYVLKPLIMGLIPARLLWRLKIRKG